MSTKPFDVGLVIDRLQSRVTGLRKVGASADYAQVRSLGDFPAPCAYVILGAERAIQTKSGMSMPGKQNPLTQVVSVGIGIVMVFRNFRGIEGDELRDELREQVGAVRNELLGWTPSVDGGRQLQLSGGDLDDYDKSTAMWIDTWQTQHVIKPEITA